MKDLSKYAWHIRSVSQVFHTYLNTGEEKRNFLRTQNNNLAAQTLIIFFALLRCSSLSFHSNNFNIVLSYKNNLTEAPCSQKLLPNVYTVSTWFPNQFLYRAVIINHLIPWLQFSAVYWSDKHMPSINQTSYLN